MDKHQYAAYRRLKDDGVDVRKHNSVRFNAGGSAETTKHAVAKTLAAKVLLANDYRVDSEVEMQHGTVDILGWGNPDRLNYVVELETSPDAETKDDKLTRYVLNQQTIDDMILINVTDMPVNMLDALDYVSDQLGMHP
jgi:RecB family endonuclease NucS